MDENDRAKLAAIEVLLGLTLRHLALLAKEQGIPSDQFFAGVREAGEKEIASIQFNDVRRENVLAQYRVITGFFGEAGL